mgnify:FL=1|tara:strand:+ start:11923 stop:12774 length:852 start_codon:yes stop_codon:yes gene_type:complete
MGENQYGKESVMENVLKHVIEKIDAASVQDYLDGYPYLSIPNIFPQDYYEELVSILKGIDDGVFHPLSKNYQRRDVYDLYCGENAMAPKQNFSNLKEGESAFLKNFQETFLIKNDFKMAFFRKYKNHMDFPDYDAALPTCRVQRDHRGYSIGPHRDRRDKLFSVMIYTPTIDKEELTEELKIDHGTDICILNHENPTTAPQLPGQVGHGADRHFTYDEVTIVKTAPSEPNSLFSWAVAEKSFHGVSPLKSDMVRSTLAYFVKIPKHLMPQHKLYGSSEFKTRK